MRDASNIYMGNISLLLHLLLDTPSRSIALARITPPIPIAEAAEIWEAWAPYLAHEGRPAFHGATARDFFTNILTSSPSNV